MKLSEAIRKGAKLRPQSRNGHYFELDQDGQICSCVFGAAYEGIGNVASIRHAGDAMRELSNKTNTPLFEYGYKSPVDGLDISLYWIILNLNDKYEWTREQIADWLEGIGL